MTAQTGLSVVGRKMPLRLLCLLLFFTGAVLAEALTPGGTYVLELPDGSRLHGAVYRGQEAGVDSFELASVVGTVRLRKYRVLPPAKKMPWLLAATPGFQLPLNQPELGFSHGLNMQLSANTPLFEGAHAALPRLAVSAGFSRYSGSKALLSGPEFAAGPGWMMALGKRWFALLNLAAGAAFYELLNLNMNEKFSQTTLIAAAELGLGLHLSEWGLVCSYVQNYVHDEKLPLLTAGVRIGAVYFGGKV